MLREVTVLLNCTSLLPLHSGISTGISTGNPFWIPSGILCDKVRCRFRGLANVLLVIFLQQFQFALVPGEKDEDEQCAD